jgi:hypothetical protein
MACTGAGRAARTRPGCAAARAAHGRANGADVSPPKRDFAAPMLPPPWQREREHPVGGRRRGTATTARGGGAGRWRGHAPVERLWGWEEADGRRWRKKGEGAYSLSPLAPFPARSPPPLPPRCCPSLLALPCPSVMGDVAQILAGAAASSSSAAGAGGDLGGPFRRRTAAAAAPDAAGAAAAAAKPGKKKKLSREVSALLGDQPQELLPMMVRGRERGAKHKQSARNALAPHHHAAPPPPPFPPRVQAPAKKITLGGFKAKRGASRSNRWCVAHMPASPPPSCPPLPLTLSPPPPSRAGPGSPSPPPPGATASR